MHRQIIDYSTNYVRGEFADAAPALLVPEPITNGSCLVTSKPRPADALQSAATNAAFSATTDQAAVLNLTVGAPVLIERHWWTDADGTVLDYAESVEPGERWRTRCYKADDPSP
jgi:hypothetical protein